MRLWTQAGRSLIYILYIKNILRSYMAIASYTYIIIIIIIIIKLMISQYTQKTYRITYIELIIDRVY